MLTYPCIVWICDQDKEDKEHQTMKDDKSKNEKVWAELIHSNNEDSTTVNDAKYVTPSDKYSNNEKRS